MSEKIMLVETIEDIFDKSGEVVGKRCSNSDGDSVKVKNPRGSNLKERWGELEEGMAYKFIMGEYKPKDSDQSFPYVKDFVSVASELAEKVEKPPSKPKPRGVPQSDINRSIEKQVALKGAVEITKALIESKTWGKTDLTIKNINATIKKIANSNDEWLMGSHEVAEKIQEEIKKGE